MPVLVPAGTWMARQFAGETYRHLENLRGQLAALEVLADEQIHWRTNAGSKETLVGEIYVSGDSIANTRVWPPQHANYLIVKIEFGSGPREVVLSVDRIEQQCVGPDPARLGLCRELSLPLWRRLLEAQAGGFCCLALIPLPRDPGVLCIGMRSPHPRQAVRVAGVRFEFLRGGIGLERPPAGAVGLVYQDPLEVSESLRELIDLYPHYQASAREFEGRRTRYHNSDRLVEQLGMMAEPGR